MSVYPQQIYDMTNFDALLPFQKWTLMDFDRMLAQGVNSEEV